MANWTIVVWAAITADLREPFEADLKEVALALATRGPASAPGSAFQLHVAQTLPVKKRLHLPPPINDLGTVPDGAALRRKLLNRKNGWVDDQDRPGPEASARPVGTWSTWASGRREALHGVPTAGGGPRGVHEVIDPHPAGARHHRVRRVPDGFRDDGHGR